MGLPYAVIVLPLVMLLAFVVVLIRRLRPRNRMTLVVAPNQHVGVVAIARHTRICRILGALLGLGAAVALARAGDAALGRIALLSPMAVGAGALIGVIVGEWTARVPRGIARTASLKRRTLTELLPRSSRVRLGVGIATVMAVLLTGTLLGSPDDIGRPGRALVRTCTRLIGGELTPVTGARGPWPGSYYAAPAAIALLGVLVLAAVAVWAIVARQRPSAEDAVLDDQLRRWSVMSVASATTATLYLLAAPLAISMLWILRANLALDGCCYPGDQALMWAVFVIGPACLVAGAVSLIELFVGARVVVDEPAGGIPPATAGVPAR